MDNKKIAIYSRKSKFTGKGESIENQIELCKTYIKNRNPEIKDEDILVFEDEGYSGKNMNRPQFQLMMKAAKEKKPSASLCKLVHIVPYSFSYRFTLQLSKD